MAAARELRRRARLRAREWGGVGEMLAKPRAPRKGEACFFPFFSFFITKM
jgi:hypothetical protein